MLHFIPPLGHSSIAKFLISSSYFSVLRPDTRNRRVFISVPTPWARRPCCSWHLPSLWRGHLFLSAQEALGYLCSRPGRGKSRRTREASRSITKLVPALGFEHRLGWWRGGGRLQCRGPLTAPPAPPARPSSGPLRGWAPQRSSRRPHGALCFLGCACCHHGPFPALEEEQDPRAMS